MKFTIADVGRIGLAEFAQKLFKTEGRRSSMIDLQPEAFLSWVNDHILAGAVKQADAKMSFCKYLILPNFTNAHVSHVRIDNSNAQWLRSGYEARTERELPVLTRWFDFPCPVKQADLLLLILYSKEQLKLEAASSGDPVPDAEWSIISIIPLDEEVVPPMPPITAMRNALGVEEGGNGAPLDREDYLASVAYWETHAVVR